MREIKFRGKRVDSGEWVYGSLLFDYEQNEAFIAEYFEDKSAYIKKVIPETVGQFTGFVAQSGQEVYEDDIVKDGAGNIYRVKRWGGTGSQSKGFGGFESWMCCAKEKDGSWKHHTKALHFNGMMVIGNIHDNPELLNQS